MADAVMRHLVAEAGLADEIQVDSAGTGDWHVGSRPHRETQAELGRRGVPVGEQRARQVTADDFHEFDYIVAMDSDNLADLRALAHGRDVHAELSLLLAHAPRITERDVPDPYYVGGFDIVYDLVAAACAELLEEICEAEGLTPLNAAG
jgi:protein-tyrosine phosphatase